MSLIHHGQYFWKCPSLMVIFFIVCSLFCSDIHCDSPSITVSKQDVEFELDDIGWFTVILSASPNESITLTLNASRNTIILTPEVLHFSNESFLQQNVTIKGKQAGKVNVDIQQDPDNTFQYDTDDAFVRVSVKVHSYLDTLDDVIGWIYFVAWSVSFYPQIWINFRRRSVIGLNLDFVCLNVLGFFCYSMYNCGLYFIPTVKQEYFDNHPYGVMPVQVQDIVFALHALFASSLTALEAIIFDRGPQRVSYIALAIIGLAFLFLIISLILSCTAVITWLDYLYYFSYVKLAITIIKYVPQAYFNFRRKSTRGWSIGNILLDFTGGAMSMIQMFIIAFNYDDWSSLFGDPTKFGLGLFSILFDVLFMVQHYILYRNKKPNYENIDKETNEQSGDQDTNRRMTGQYSSMDATDIKL